MSLRPISNAAFWHMVFCACAVLTARMRSVALARRSRILNAGVYASRCSIERGAPGLIVSAAVNALRPAKAAAQNMTTL